MPPVRPRPHPAQLPLSSLTRFCTAAALAERDGNGHTPLHRAAQCTQPEGAAADGVRLLLAAGADATAKDSYGYTALHRAAYDGPDDPSLAGVLLACSCGLWPMRQTCTVRPSPGVLTTS